MSALLAFFMSSAGRMVAVGAVSAIAAASISVWATSIYYKADIANLHAQAASNERDNAVASLKQFEAASDKIAKAANDYANVKLNFDAQFSAISKDLANAQKIKLPANCKPDIGRVRSLSAAVAAVNAEIGSKPSTAVQNAN